MSFTTVRPKFVKKIQCTAWKASKYTKWNSSLSFTSMTKKKAYLKVSFSNTKNQKGKTNKYQFWNPVKLSPSDLLKTELQNENVNTEVRGVKKKQCIQKTKGRIHTFTSKLTETEVNEKRTVQCLLSCSGP